MGSEHRNAQHTTPTRSGCPSYPVPADDRHRHSPLDDAAHADDLLPTSTGELVDEPEERPSMLTIEGRIWGFRQGRAVRRDRHRSEKPPPRGSGSSWLPAAVLAAIGFEIARLLRIG